MKKSSRRGFISEDVLKAISGFLIIMAFVAVIGLVAGASGSGSGTSSKPSNESKDKIYFIVNNMLYEVPEDTTWEEFVSNESLNTPGFTIQDNNVYLGDSKVIDSETNLPVTSDMPIGSDVIYKDEGFVEDSGSDSNGENNVQLSSFVYAQTSSWYSTPIERNFEIGMSWEEFVNSSYNDEQKTVYIGSNGTYLVGKFIINQDNTISFKGKGSNASDPYLTYKVLSDDDYHHVLASEDVLNSTYHSVDNRHAGGAN